MQPYRELRRYELPLGTLAELREQENQGFVFVAVEDDLNVLGKRTGLVDVAGQCALGNVESVLTGELRAVFKTTREPVDLTFYFVERLQYQAACREERRRHANL